MTIRGFNQDVIEPYYVANLLSADPHDIDVFHCGIHLVCRHSAVQTVLSGISPNTPHHDVVSKCMRNLMAMNPDFSEFTMFKDEWNIDNPEVPFAPIMGAVSPVLAETLRGVYDEKMKSEPDSSEVEELFRTHFALNNTEIEIVRFIYFLNTFAYGIYEGTRSRRRPKQVIKKDIHNKCGWSPFEGEIFDARVEKTFVNGKLAYDNGKFDESVRGRRLTFDVN